jgi:predicted dehydrogenase
MNVTSTGAAIRFEGSAGWVGNKGWEGRLEGSDITVFRRKYEPGANKLWPRRPREQRDFLDCLKNGQPPLYTAEALHRLSTALHIGAIAMEVGRPLRWDPEKESFKDDAEANALRSRPVRNDWRRV